MNTIKLSEVTKICSKTNTFFTYKGKNCIIKFGFHCSLEDQKQPDFNQDALYLNQVLNQHELKIIAKLTQ